MVTEEAVGGVHHIHIKVSLRTHSNNKFGKKNQIHSIAKSAWMRNSVRSGLLYMVGKFKGGDP